MLPPTIIVNRILLLWTLILYIILFTVANRFIIIKSIDALAHVICDHISLDIRNILNICLFVIDCSTICCVIIDQFSALTIGLGFLAVNVYGASIHCHIWNPSGSHVIVDNGLSAAGTIVVVVVHLKLGLLGRLVSIMLLLVILLLLLLLSSVWPSLIVLLLLLLLFLLPSVVSILRLIPTIVEEWI